MGFKDWLKVQEMTTSTACIAIFSRPMLPIIRRGFFGEPLFDEPEEKKPPKRKKKSKKKKKKD